MAKLTALKKEVQMAIHARAEQLFELITEAERNGLSPEVIDRHLTEELEAMEAQLRAIYPPKLVQAIVGELIGAYDVIRRSASH